MIFIQLLVIFCHLAMVYVVEFRIDGQVDIGPKLNYKVQIAQVTDGIKLALRKSKKSDTDSNTWQETTTEAIHKTTIKIAKDKIQAKLIVKDQSVQNMRAGDEFRTKINLSLNFQNDETKGIAPRKHKRIKFDVPRSKLDSEINSAPKQRAAYTFQKIKDVESLQKYFNHLYNRALRAFDALREQNKVEIEKSQLHRIKHMYMNKIHEYILNMENQTLRTELGWQKAILNTLQVSNKIANKLLDRIEPPITVSKALRNDVLPTYAIQKEFETDEYYFMCIEYNICRTQRSFSDFLAQIFIMILKTDDHDIKQASDALTEVIVDLNYQKIMDYESHGQFSVAIKKMEALSPRDTRFMLTIFKNMIVHRNMPIKIFGSENMALINKTIAFQTILNEFDTALPGNKENIKKWDHVAKALEKWTVNEKDRILGICKKIVKIINKGIDYMPDSSADTVRDNLRLILAET